MLLIKPSPKESEVNSANTVVKMEDAEKIPKTQIPKL